MVPEEQSSTEGTRKTISLNLSAEAYSELFGLAVRTRRYVTTVIQEALAFEKWYWDARADGARVLVERGTDRFTELRRPEGSASVEEVLTYPLGRGDATREGGTEGDQTESDQGPR